MTSKEADDDEDSKTISNYPEVENDERDLLIEKSDILHTETMAKNDIRVGLESRSTSNSNTKSGSFHRFSNIGRFLPSKLYFYFNNSTTEQNFPQPDYDEGNNFWRTIAANPLSIRDSKRLYYRFSNLSTKDKAYSSRLESINCDNYHDDDGNLLRCIKTRGHKYSNRRKWRILLTLLVAIILIFTSIYLLIKLFILIQKHKNLLEYQQNDWILKSENLHRESDQFNEATSSGWLISSPKCHIPAINPWDKSIDSYVKLESDLNCHEISKKQGFSQNALTYVSENKLFLNNQALAVSDNSSFINCCYRQILRSDENDDDLIYNETCNPIEISDTNSLTIPFELIKLECSQNNYTNYHSFIVHDLEEEEAFKRIAEKKLNADQYYNVLLVGMDTISRLNGHRQLNGTLDILRKTYKTLEFYGYNKVGENTFPNLIPLITGLKPTQLTETQCWLPTSYTDEGESGDDYLDNCKYLWNFYQEYGYVTYFSEDWSTFSTFNYLKPGFKRKPTLFYGRPFARARNNLLLPNNPGGCSMCLLDKPIVELDLTNLKTFVKEQQNSPYFALHWINCPQHDDLNGASQIDTIVRKFFEEIHSLVSERTFIIFFSDHGYRWNNFISTRIGHYEASLPLLTIAPPKHFIDKHPDLYENLKHHRRALVTPFDVFKTLIAIRNLGAKSQQQHQKLKRFPVSHLDKTNDYSISDSIVETAFTSSPTATTTVKQLQQVDGLTFKQDFRTLSLLDKHNDSELDRSCTEAGIPDNYCVCHEFSKVNPHSLYVKGAAYYFVYVHLYDRIRESQDICEFLDLDTIKESQVFDFKRMRSSSTNKTETKTSSKRRKKRSDHDSKQDAELSSSTSRNIESFTRTTPPPNKSSSKEGVVEDYHLSLKREYNIRVVTKPGFGLFQEVVRYYGSNIANCKTEIKRAEHLLKNPYKKHQEKYDIVMKINRVCKFSVHSESISRLNLYKGQSDCVNNNIELKKICYCKNQ